MEEADTAIAIALILGLLMLGGSALLARERLRRDQEEALRLEQQLHAQRVAAIGAMAAGVVRDIGNPIAAIDAYARAMVDAQQRGEIAPPPQPHYDPQLIVGEASRLVAITHSIAQLASGSANQPQFVSVNEVVRHALALLRYDPRLERATLHTALDPQVPATAAVPERLVLLVTQLVAHALEAGSRRVTVSTRGEPGTIEIAVEGDRGCAESEPALVRLIAQEHGGVTKINSTGSSGACARVWLPVRPLN